METTQIIRDYYNATVEGEWGRIANRPEFLLTCRFLSRHIRPGNKVLDIGGGPGRYALHLASLGCEVTLLDLSEENVRFAAQKAREQNLDLRTLCGDAREAAALVNDTFDHVLLMGPLYHLLEEADRITAVRQALQLLKPGGTLSASFINVYAGMIYAMKCDPQLVTDQAEDQFFQTILRERNFAGFAFTQAFFIWQKNVLPFMAQFPLEKLHFFGQEGVTAPCESNLMSQPAEVIESWLDLSEALAERDELLSWNEHLMFIGRKI